MDDPPEPDNPSPNQIAASKFDLTEDEAPSSRAIVRFESEGFKYEIKLNLVRWLITLGLLLAAGFLALIVINLVTNFSIPYWLVSALIGAVSALVGGSIGFAISLRSRRQVEETYIDVLKDMEARREGGEGSS